MKQASLFALANPALVAKLIRHENKVALTSQKKEALLDNFTLFFANALITQLIRKLFRNKDEAKQAKSIKFFISRLKQILNKDKEAAILLAKKILQIIDALKLETLFDEDKFKAKDKESIEIMENLLEQIKADLKKTFLGEKILEDLKNQVPEKSLQELNNVFRLASSICKTEDQTDDINKKIANFNSDDHTKMIAYDKDSEMYAIGKVLEEIFKNIDKTKIYNKLDNGKKQFVNEETKYIYYQIMHFIEFCQNIERTKRPACETVKNELHRLLNMLNYLENKQEEDIVDKIGFVNCNLILAASKNADLHQELGQYLKQFNKIIIVANQDTPINEIIDAKNELENENYKVKKYYVLSDKKLANQHKIIENIQPSNQQPIESPKNRDKIIDLYKSRQSKKKKPLLKNQRLSLAQIIAGKFNKHELKHDSSSGGDLSSASLENSGIGMEMSGGSSASISPINKHRSRFPGKLDKKPRFIQRHSVSNLRTTSIFRTDDTKTQLNIVTEEPITEITPRHKGTSYIQKKKFY